MQVVLVEPGKAARITEIGEDLQDMQEIVGGLIQALYPWEDPAAIVCNAAKISAEVSMPGKIYSHTKWAFVPQNRVGSDSEREKQKAV